MADGTHRQRPRAPVARLEDLEGDGPFAASAGTTELVLIRLDGKLKAYEGLCPHQGALLGEGEFDGESIVCRNHRWCFDARTGRRKDGPECLKEFPVHTDPEGNVSVELDPEAIADEATQVRTYSSLPGPRGWPFFGNAPQLNLDALHLNFEHWADEYGSPYRMRIGRRKLFVVRDPEVSAEVFRARPKVYRRASNVSVVLSELGADGVFTAEGQRWRAQRRLAMGALSHRHLGGFFPTLRAVADRLRGHWERAVDTPLTAAEEFMLFTVDVTTSLAFGRDTNTIENGGEELRDNLGPFFPKASERINSVIPYWRWFRLPSDRRADHGVATVRAWLETLINETRAELEAAPERRAAPANFLEAMISAKDADGNPFPEETIFANALTMLLAGEDTTANTLAWAVHHLCDHPEAVAELRAELDRELGEHTVPPDLATADRLDYALAIANETMRLRPVAPIIIFEPNEDVILKGVLVPKDTSIVVLTRLGATKAERHGAPQFDPSRWMDPARAAELTRDGRHVPFGSGPRICPGRTLALLEMRMALATLYRNFDVERVGSSDDVREHFAFTMTPQGFVFRLRPRER